MPQYDINAKGKNGFFTDANMEELAVPASYADWAPGFNEQGKNIRGRPVGDYSTLGIADGTEYVEDVNNEGSI